MPIPLGVIGGPAQLTWYIGQDNKLYAHELQTDCLFPLSEDPSSSGASGVPEAPTDGSLYGRENAAWQKVPTGGSGVQNPSTQQIVVKGDQFLFDTALAPTPALMVEPSSGTGGLGIAIGKFGDSICFVKANGTGANVRMAPGTFLTLSDSNNNDAIQINVSQGFIKLINTNSGTAFNLSCDANGDLIVTSAGGPNIGKTVNLTAGKWT